MVFEDLYKTYWQKVFRLCMGYVNNHDWAKDLVQETFIIVWQHLPAFRNEAAIGTWIFRIASNICLRQMEKQQRLPQAEMPVQIADHPETMIENNTQLLYRFISQLPETDRIIISLELEEVKQAEIATITGLSEANIRVKVHRIKEKLSKKFNQHEQ